MSKKIDTKKFLEDIKRLKTPANYAKTVMSRKGKPVTRQHIAKLISDKKIPFVYIDGVPFVIIDEKEPEKGKENKGK